MSQPESRFSQQVPIRSRVDVIDALRGFALLGILIMNIQVFAMPEQAYLNPLLFGTEQGRLSGLSGWMYVLTHTFADQKFMTIFSLLFGVSIMLIAESRPQGATKYLLRRNFFLLLIGLEHAYLLWKGDILVTYALCACTVVWLRHLSAGKLLAVGFCIFLVPVFLALLGTALLPYWTTQDIAAITSAWHPSVEEINAQIENMRGSWLQNMHERVPAAFEMQSIVFLSQTAWRVSALMIWGMALYKFNLFGGALSSRSCRNLALLILLLGLIIVVLGIQQNIEHGWQASYSLFIGNIYNYLGSAMVSMAYVCLFIYLYKRNKDSALMSALQSVGRTALSNYLLQSLICTFIFYGFGLGLFASLSRAQQLLLLPLIWSLQILLSVYWLKYFYYGPVEWLWRTAVEWRDLPFKRK